ncbi:MAG: metalloregulator ArsR/SmtB family transcription factor [Acidobacteria bacterium]|nr:metalloregulator ArsR/SmtB family transcription factor [Acidobacteriota bacterium]
MVKAAVIYRLLGDEVRLRLLRVLLRERLNVTELTAVLGVAQSGVSRHLGLLKDAGLVDEEPAGGFTYYGLSPALTSGPLASLWAHLDSDAAGMGGSPLVRGDEARLQEVLRVRRENFDPHASDAGRLVPGRSWAAWSRALACLLPPVEVADLGCGEGYLTLEAARWARHVIAVDRDPEVLRKARALARRRGVTNIIWRRGDIERLPLDSASVDVALLSQALHQAGDPARAVAEAVRILRPGGRLLVLELRPHDQTWVKQRLGDQWLGFADDAIARLLRTAGLVDVSVQLGARGAGGPFAVTIACGCKREPARRARRVRTPSR